jgi:acetyl-CoA acetyltransferase
MTEAYIYDAIRTPRGKGRKDGSLHEVTSARLSAGVLNELKSRNNLEGHALHARLFWRRNLIYLSPVLPSTASAPQAWKL